MFKIKINRSPIFNLICVVLLIDSSILKDLQIPILQKDNVGFLIGIMISFALLINHIMNTSINSLTRPCMNYYYFYLIVWVIFVVTVSAFSIFKYDETITDMIKCIKYYYPLLLFPPLVYVFIKQDDYKGILNFLLTVTILVISIRLFKAVIYNFGGRLILGNIQYSFRSDRMRIGMTTAVGVAFVYSICRFTNIKKINLSKIMYGFSMCLILFYTFYTNMTRMYIVAIVVAFTVTIIFKRRPINKEILLLIGIGAVAVAGVLSGTINTFIESFSSQSSVETALSTIARNNANDYFRGIVDNNPIFGMGFVSPNDLRLSMIFFGPDLTACLDDLGLINMWYHYGVFGIIIVGALFARWIHLALRLLISKSFEEKQFIFGIIAYNVCLIPSLSIFDAQRFIMIPLIWALLEYFNFKNRSERAEFKKKLKEKQKIKFNLVKNKNQEKA